MAILGAAVKPPRIRVDSCSSLPTVLYLRQFVGYKALVGNVRTPITPNEGTMTDDWKAEWDRAYEETVKLLEELKKCRVVYKRVAEFRFVECECPMWQGMNEEEVL